MGSSQVRVILRDVSGKFSWDCSALYGANDDVMGVAPSGVSDSDELREKFFPEDLLRNMIAAGGSR